MVTLIVGLFVLGLCFISLELIVPGGILGGIGLLAVLGSWALAFVEFGAVGGMLAVLAGVVLIGLSLFVELKLVPRTPLGQRLFLKGSIGGTSQPPKAEVTVVGKEGQTLTTLAPTGVVRVDGHEYEGFSISGMMERGTKVEVVDYDNFRVRVKRI
jgi:membrane-bound serine protease (ClpP class)